MSYRSEKFNARMRSLDTMAERRDASKWPPISDHGKGADAIRKSTYRDMWIGAARERAIQADNYDPENAKEARA